MMDNHIFEAIEAIQKRRLQRLQEADRLHRAKMLACCGAGTITADGVDTSSAARGPPVSDDDLPLKTLHELMHAFDRYSLVFVPSYTLEPSIPRPPVSHSTRVPMVPWIIEAPLNSVEIFEAILKPSHPFIIYEASHFRCGPAQTSRGRTSLARLHSRYTEYTRLQGRLEAEREISFICIPENAVEIIRQKLFGVFATVKLQYIFIPWPLGGEGRTLMHPWALVLHDKSRPGTIHTYEQRLALTLDRLGLSDSERQFKRSLLRYGTTPLPECLWDWFAGREGTTQALPYFASSEDIEANRRVTDNYVQTDGGHQGELGVMLPCCLPTVTVELA